MRVAIIGGGAAGFEAAKSVREREQDWQITVYSDEGVPPYRRPSLTQMFSAPISDKQFFLAGEEFYSAKGIELALNSTVAAIDIEARELRLGDGRSAAFDRLLIATGASANALPIPGGDADGVFRARKIADLERIEAYMLRETPRKAVVVGGGLLGLEFAAALIARGIEVSVLEYFPTIMPRQLDPAGAQIFAGAMAKFQGLSARYGVEVKAIEADNGKVARVILGDGVIDAQMVVWAVGTRPNIELAAAAGLAVNRGIVVDRSLVSSVPNIYAAGDCAEVGGVVSGLWNPAKEQGAVAAACICGDRVGYTPRPSAARFVGFNTKLYSLGTVNPEPAAECERIVEVNDPATGVYRALTYSGKRLVGALLIGDLANALQFEKQLLEG